MTRSALLRLLVVAACAVLALAGCSSSGSTSPSSSASQLNDANGTGTFDGSPLTPAYPRPSFLLDDTTGKSVSLSAVTSGHPTLLYFGYTNCPDVCPATMADIQLALQKVPADVAAKTDVVFVSTDVKRDTGPVIAKWLANFSTGSKATWIGLRGTQAQIDAAQAAAHVPLASDGGQTHASETLLFGPDNYAHVAYLQSTTFTQQVAHDLPLVASGKS